MMKDKQEHDTILYEIKQMKKKIKHLDVFGCLIKKIGPPRRSGEHLCKGGGPHR